MADCIDREEAKKLFRTNFGSVMDAVIAERLLDEVPAAAVNHGRWISVKDRLPKDHNTVICYSAAGVFAGWYGKLGGNWYFEHGHGQLVRHKVTHWMPMPEPPEEDE